jgi:hypothetical protein
MQVVELVDTEKKNDGNTVGHSITAVLLVCLVLRFSFITKWLALCLLSFNTVRVEKKTWHLLLTCSEKVLHRIYGNITKDGSGYITGGREEKVKRSI